MCFPPYYQCTGVSTARSASCHPLKWARALMTQNPYSPPQSNVEASLQEAPRAGTPSGIGGWLLLPLLALIVTPIRVGILVTADLLPVFDPQVWSRLTTPGNAAYHPLWAPLLIFEVVANIGIIVVSIVLLWLFLRKSSRLPGLYIVWLLANASIQIIDVGLGSQVPAVSAGIGEGLKELGRSLVGAAIWIPYFRRSVRVKNTFTRSGS